MKPIINRKKIVLTFVQIFVTLFINQFCFSLTINENIKDQTGSPSATNLDADIKKEPVFQSLPANFEYNGVTCILKDYKGYMWFGTIDGLIRYDGINLYVYEKNPDDSASLSHNSINALVEDKNKNLWIGTSEGLNLYNRDMDNFIHIGSIDTNLFRLSDSYISALCLDKKSLLWVGTFDGVNIYDPEKQTIKYYSYNTYYIEDGM